LLQAFDIFVMPSFHEGLPVTLVEAQAAGLPCFISNRITKEVDMGADLVHYLPINNVSDWVSLITNYEKIRKRNSTKVALMSKGYDIIETAEKLTLSYRSLGERAI